MKLGLRFGRETHPVSPKAGRRMGRTPFRYCKCGFPCDTRTTAWAHGANDGDGGLSIQNVSTNAIVQGTTIVEHANQIRFETAPEQNLRGWLIKIDYENPDYLVWRKILEHNTLGLTELDAMVDPPYEGPTGGFCAYTAVKSYSLKPPYVPKESVVTQGCPFCGRVQWLDSKPKALPDDENLPAKDWLRRRRK